MPPAAVTRWPPLSVVSLEAALGELAELVEQTATRQDHSAEREANWLARLLVIRSCGYLEQVVAEVAASLTQARSGGLIRSFASSWLPPGRNPHPDQLSQWVGRFDANWGVELEEILDAEDELLRREISLLVDRRNRIAHGLNEGVTVRKALDLKEAAVTLADWFVLRFNPGR